MAKQPNFEHSAPSSGIKLIFFSLLASCCDDRGELVKTVTINIEIPNKTRRKKASARRVGLRKLMDWIQSVMSMSLVPWRLVIGRIGRIGHGELRGMYFINRKTFLRLPQ